MSLGLIVTLTHDSKCVSCDGDLEAGEMTKRVRDHASFIDWHYKHDPTHINFYSEATFEWIAQAYQWQLEIIDNDVVFFRAP